MITKNEYYPFGMLFDGQSVSSGNYRYGYGSTHEMDNEVKGTGKHSEFGGYGYDPRVGRRWNVEPLIANFPSVSSYVTYGNNPNIYTDLDGKEPIPYGRKWFGKKRQEWQWYSYMGNYDEETFHSAAIYSTTAQKVNAYQTVYQRSAYYGWVQEQVSAKGYNSKSFGAAEDVTGIWGVGGTEIPDKSFVTDHDVDKFLQEGNKFLFNLNMKNAKDLLNDGVLTGGFIDANGMNQTFTGLSGIELDYKLVEFEQSKVQEFINNYTGGDEIFDKINSVMNGDFPPALFSKTKEVIESKFNNQFDFRKYEDRVKLGKSLIEMEHTK